MKLFSRAVLSVTIVSVSAFVVACSAGNGSRSGNVNGGSAGGAGMSNGGGGLGSFGNPSGTGLAGDGGIPAGGGAGTGGALLPDGGTGPVALDMCRARSR